ncbi:MAG TPA: hypothetical protein VGF30_02520, partial [Bacteroidia bacterium]
LYRPIVFLSQALLFTLTSLSICSITNVIFSDWLGVQLSKVQKLISGFVFSAALYFFTSQIIEIYTYTSSFFSYYMPVSFLCFALSIIIKERATAWMYLFLLLSAFSVGGSAENVSASSLACLGLFFSVALLRKKFAIRELFADKRIRKLFVFIILTSCFAVVAYTAPGARNRALTEENNLFLKANVLFSPVDFDIFLWKFSHPTNIMAVMILGWFTYLGFLIPGDKKKIVRSILGWTFGFFIVAVSVHLLITKVIFDSYGYLRIWFPVNFYICVFSASFMLYFGVMIRNKLKRAAPLVFGGLSLFFVCFYFYRHYLPVSEFSYKYFERRAYVKNHCNSNPADSLIVPRPGNPDILYFDKFLRFPQDSLSTYFCIFNEIPCKNVEVK